MKIYDLIKNTISNYDIIMGENEYYFIHHISGKINIPYPIIVYLNLHFIFNNHPNYIRTINYTNLFNELETSKILNRLLNEHKNELFSIYREIELGKLV